MADESDVPVWDHTKRDNRYAIRPLIPLGNGIELSWGAAFVKKSIGIWSNAITNGYLPADFPWIKVQKEVRNVKKGLELALEERSYEISSRFSCYIEKGINFKHRFPNEMFENVGDFDVLAYWPEENEWLIIECKYNQPPYCF